MNDTYKTICNLIKAIFCGDTFKADEGIDWNTVFSEMDKQKIATLVGDMIADLPIDADLKAIWKKNIICQRIQYEQLLNEQSKVCQLLSDLPVVVIKGTAAAMYYPDPMLRIMGDIDILVGREYRGKAREILASSYELDRGDEERHTNFKKRNVEIELHKCFAIKLGQDKSRYFDDVIFDAIPNAQESEIGVHRFPTLPKTENGLVILCHIFHHLQTGIGLRHVIDWMAYVADTKPVDWTKFNCVTKEAGIYRFQCVITRMCEIYLGLEHREDIDWCNDADESLCDRLMEYIISRGNFGRSMDTYASQFALKDIKGNVIKRLQLGGMCRWKAAQQHKILRPFAWLHQGIRVSKELLTRENPVEALQTDIKEAERVKALMEDLGLERNHAAPEK